MTLKFKFDYNCFGISLQIHNWDKCCHLVRHLFTKDRTPLPYELNDSAIQQRNGKIS